MHLHWRVPTGPTYGPFAVNRHGSWGRRQYRCRCGRTWVRDERETPKPKWREVPRG